MTLRRWASRRSLFGYRLMASLSTNATVGLGVGVRALRVARCVAEFKPCLHILGWVLTVGVEVTDARLRVLTDREVAVPARDPARVSEADDVSTSVEG